MSGSLLSKTLKSFSFSIFVNSNIVCDITSTTTTVEGVIQNTKVIVKITDV